MGKLNKKRIFDIIQIGQDNDLASRLFDIAIIVMILTNLFIAIFETFESSLPYHPVLDLLELVTVIGFTVEYALRLWTAEYLYPMQGRGRAAARYASSFSGIVDLLSFLPYYLPVFFPAGIVAFRMFRVIRILRLFRVNAYYDALGIIGDVIKRKRDQLLSSIFIILVLMIASSLCMYSLEHEAQPEVFRNAFSGFWWAVSTLLTVGYGDIYPVTLAGRLFGILITFLGVGMVAIPTGILSAGFVERYTRIKTFNDYALATDIRFVRLSVDERHPWRDRPANGLPLPPGLILAVIQRGGEVLVPSSDTVICPGDQLILGAESVQDGTELTLQELTLTDRHPWVGLAIRELDLSRKTLIVAVRREGRPLVPDGDLTVRNGDILLLFSRRKLRGASQSIQI